MKLIQTEKGLKPKYVSGDKKDDLEILKYLGKMERICKSHTELIPVYRCKCKCGNIVVRHQKYIAYSAKGGAKCDQCSHGDWRDIVRNNHPGRRHKDSKQDKVESAAALGLREVNRVWKPVCS